MKTGRRSVYEQKLSQNKKFCSVKLHYRCNSYVSQVSQKWISISVALGLQRNYFYEEVFVEKRLKNTVKTPEMGSRIRETLNLSMSADSITNADEKG